MGFIFPSVPIEEGGRGRVVSYNGIAISLSVVVTTNCCSLGTALRFPLSSIISDERLAQLGGASRGTYILWRCRRFVRIRQLSIVPSFIRAVVIISRRTKRSEEGPVCILKLWLQNFVNYHYNGGF